MRTKNFILPIALLFIALFFGCKKDDFVETPGVCPEVISTSPVDGATSVVLDKIITVTFNEAMNPATITQSSLTIMEGTSLKASATTPVLGTITYSGNTATFTPSSPLTANTNFYGTVTTAVKDLDGNALQEDYEWAFSTSTIPAVTSVTPLNLATDVPLNQAITSNFSEVMAALSITEGTTFTLTQGGISTVGTVTYTGTMATFTPTSNLLPNTVYTATISTAAKNLAGNSIPSNYVWTFTTSKIPTVISVDPLDLATNVVLNKVISAKFSELMNASTITAASTFTLKRGTTLIAGSVSYTDSDSTAKFTPSSNLLPNTLYTATISTAAKNPAGNSIASNYVWTFTTSKIPTVLSTDPVHLAANVALDKAISAKFSELMNAGTITAASTFTLKQGTNVIPGSVSYTDSDSTAIFTPSSNLQLGRTYTATISTAAKNPAGNSIASNYVWTFSTGIIIAPTVILTNPVDLATEVSINKVITANFSEAMNASTITAASTFTLMQGTTSIAGSVTYSGITARFTPSSNLLSNTLYTATISTAAKNLAGTALESDYVWTFTTGIVIVPEVILTSPLNLATGVALNKVITANFSEAMNASTITAASTFTLKQGTNLIAGSVLYSGITASFTPSSNLLAGTEYTATISTAAKNLAGTSIESDYVWTFTTINQFTLTVIAVNGTVSKNPNQLVYDDGTSVTLTASPAANYEFTSWSVDATGTDNPLTVLMDDNKNITANFSLITPVVCTPAVDLGLAGDYVILAESGISTTGTTSVVGDMGISPAAATFITGFALNLTAGAAYSTSSLVTGNIYAPGYANPTPANLTTAVDNMHTAFTTGNGLAVDVTEQSAGNLNGETLAAGVYKWGTGVSITNGITLDGGGDDCAMFVFQIAQDLTVADGAIITLANGAQAENIYWLVAGSGAVLGTTVQFQGNILSKTLISLNTGATINGRLLAQTAVTLNANSVVKP